MCVRMYKWYIFTKLSYADMYTMYVLPYLMFTIDYGRLIRSR